MCQGAGVAGAGAARTVRRGAAKARKGDRRGAAMAEAGVRSSARGKSTTTPTSAAVGMGGSGKTILASAVVRSSAIRRHFDRIAMVVVGQTPELMKVQRDLFVQLTGRRLADIVSADATMASNAEHIRTAAAGRRWLLVLDDVWDPIHEEQLCFFTDQCKAPEGIKEDVSGQQEKGAQSGSGAVDDDGGEGAVRLDGPV